MEPIVGTHELSASVVWIENIEVEGSAESWIYFILLNSS